MDIIDKIRGVVVPITPPLNKRFRVDREGVENLVNHVIGSGDKPIVNAIFVNGKTGEFQYLDIEEQKLMLQYVIAACKGRVPVLAGTTGKSEKDTINLCMFAKNAGADAVVIAPLYMYAQPERWSNNLTVVESLKNVAQATDMPIYIYNNPNLSKPHVWNPIGNIREDDMARMLNIDNVMGLKDSSGMPNLFHDYYKAAKDNGKVFFMGDERYMFLDPMRFNAVPSFANLNPWLCSRVCKLPQQKMVGYYNDLKEGGKIVYCNGSKIIPGLKYALHVMGICGPTTTVPVPELTGEEKKSIEEYVIKLSNPSSS